MLVLLSRELWQAVRSGVPRKSVSRPEIWHWTASNPGGDMVLHRGDASGPLRAVLGKTGQRAGGPLSVLVATDDLSEGFEQIVEGLTQQPGEVRVSLMLSTCLDEARAERCRRFLRSSPNLRERVSTFFLATRTNTDFTTLDPAAVSRSFLEFIQLVCQGGEPLANKLGLFRPPSTGDPEDPERMIPDGGCATTGPLAAMGIRTWSPPRERIVTLVQRMLAGHVAMEEKRAALERRFRSCGPGAVIGRALALGEDGEPLAPLHFDEEIPEPPEFPFKSWKTPYYKRRARRERHRLYRALEKDFSQHVASLEAAFDEILCQIRQQTEDSFTEAAQTYRHEVFRDLNPGSLALLVSEYFPGFDPNEQASAEETPRANWLPDRSEDPFCEAYEILDEGVHKLPSSRLWLATLPVIFAFLGAALYFREAPGWIPAAIATSGLLAPACLWVWRRIVIRDMRRRVTKLADKVYSKIRRTFEKDIEWNLHDARVRLEKRIRADATRFGERLRAELAETPWLFTGTDLENEDLQEELRRIRAELMDNGVDGQRLDRIAGRLEGLARAMVDRARGRPVDDNAEPSPAETIETWIDELAQETVLPLKKVQKAKEEILETASGWRSPPLMAPLTDADLHRGYHKVVALPDSDIAFDRIDESLPRFSGNPMVSLRVWSGTVSGIAVCSVMTGLPESILDSQVNGQAFAYEEIEIKGGNGARA